MLALGVGAQPCKAYSPNSVSSLLKSFLTRLGVHKADLYRPRDFRRGHAKDMMERLSALGSSLKDILLAGEWRLFSLYSVSCRQSTLLSGRSPAFLSYLDLHLLGERAVAEAHIDDSSGDDCGDAAPG